MPSVDVIYEAKEIPLCWDENIKSPHRITGLIKSILRCSPSVLPPLLQNCRTAAVGP